MVLNKDYFREKLRVFHTIAFSQNQLISEVERC